MIGTLIRVECPECESKMRQFFVGDGILPPWVNTRCAFVLKHVTTGKVVHACDCGYRGVIPKTPRPGVKPAWKPPTATLPPCVEEGYASQAEMPEHVHPTSGEGPLITSAKKEVDRQG